jgi:hypothetical protein
MAKLITLDFYLIQALLKSAFLIIKGKSEKQG